MGHILQGNAASWKRWNKFSFHRCFELL